MKQRKFEVYIGSRKIDIIWSDGDLMAADVRRSLINHDGYPPTISVYRNNADQSAFDSVARVSHPDEC